MISIASNLKGRLMMRDYLKKKKIQTCKNNKITNLESWMYLKSVDNCVACFFVKLFFWFLRSSGILGREIMPGRDMEDVMEFENDNSNFFKFCFISVTEKIKVLIYWLGCNGSFFSPGNKNSLWTWKEQVFFQHYMCLFCFNEPAHSNT